jgi:hypothetical protein
MIPRSSTGSSSTWVPFIFGEGAWRAPLRLAVSLDGRLPPVLIYAVDDLQFFRGAATRFLRMLVPPTFLPFSATDTDPEVVDHVVALARSAVVDGLGTVAVWFAPRIDFARWWLEHGEDFAAT